MTNHIFRNFAWHEDFSEESFVSQLHETCVWDDKEYFLLEDFLYETCTTFDVENIPRSTFWPAMRIYSYLMLMLGCHLDPDDGFVIKNITREQFSERRERLQLVFEGFFKGEMPDKDILGY